MFKKNPYQDIVGISFESLNASRSIFCGFSAASRVVPVWIKALLYKSLVRGSLLYGVPILTMGCEAAWNLLEMLERRALCTALRLSHF